MDVYRECRGRCATAAFYESPDCAPIVITDLGANLMIEIIICLTACSVVWGGDHGCPFMKVTQWVSARFLLSGKNRVLLARGLGSGWGELEDVDGGLV